jgi:hypothetical protein
MQERIAELERRLAEVERQRRRAERCGGLLFTLALLLASAGLICMSQRHGHTQAAHPRRLSAPALQGRR